MDATLASCFNDILKSYALVYLFDVGLKVACGHWKLWQFLICDKDCDLSCDFYFTALQQYLHISEP